MKTLTFQGYSDDTFACEGPGIDVDRDTCASGRPVHMRVESNGFALIVTGQYARGPCAGWCIGVGPADFGLEERPIPAWPIRIMPGDAEYSPVLTIEAPDDVEVTLIDAKGNRQPRSEAERQDLLAAARAEIDQLRDHVEGVLRELATVEGATKRALSATALALKTGRKPR